MAKRIAGIFLIGLILGGLAFGSYFLGYEAGRLKPKNIVIEGVQNMNPESEVDADFSVFWQAWDVLNREYLNNASTSNKEKVYGSIRGLLGSLKDPYTVFFSPEDNQRFQADIQGVFGGIGAEIGIKNGVIVVVSPLKDTPAFKAGLKAGDMILRVNSTSTEGMRVDEAVQIIRGEAGTEVTLFIAREEWDAPKEIKIKRAIIVVPTLEYEMKPDGIAHIELSSFNAQAEGLLHGVVREAFNDGARGIILDLRNNPGGYLDVAVNLAGWFLPRGNVVVKEVPRNGEEKIFYANGNESLAKIPVVVLINGGSASASEILAGTLRDNRKIKLIGEQSFGKGSVQQIEELKDGSSLKITIAHWVLPSGIVFESGGLEPDIEIKITEEDREKERDPQLDKAIEVIREEIRNDR